MPVVAGADPASGKYDIVVFADGEFTTHSWRAEGKKWSPRNCRDVYRWALDDLGEVDPGTIWVEEPTMGRGGPHSTIVQALTSGAAQAALVHLGWDVRMVSVPTWKLNTVGSGNASKDDVREFVEHSWSSAWSVVEGNPDLVDAACICVYGIEIGARAGHLMDGSLSL